MTSKTRNTFGTLAALMAAAAGLVSVSASAGSAIGNGGDIFSHYVESSRFALKESIRRLMQNTTDRDQVCETQQGLDPGQRAECRDFIIHTMQQILDLNQRPPVPAFLLRSDPLLIIGPDGKPREVDARTQLGPDGDIELNHDRVKFHSPFQMLTLITHEFGHKVFFHGKVVEDNQATSVFPTGRMLLDSAGIAIATFAQQKSVIGSYFRLLDHFSCQIRSFPDSTPMGSSGFTSRTFSSQQEFGRYETGIGILPGNLDVYLIDSALSEIHFRALIHEENGCSTEGSPRRWTKLSLVRTYASLGGPADKPDEVLAENLIDQWNPVCDDPASRKPLELSYGSFRFECFYNGSSGTSSAN